MLRASVAGFPGRGGWAPDLNELGGTVRIFGIVLVVVLAFGGVAHAFPNEERASLSLGLSQSTQFEISSDNTTLYLCYGNKFQTVDTGTFALTSPQPFDISTDTTTYPGNFTGLIYFPSQNAVICPQDNGSAILYNLNDITATPTILTIASGKQLGKGAADTVGGENIYVVDVTDNSVVQYSVTRNTATQISLIGVLVSNFTVNNIVFSPQSTSDLSEIYLSTSAGSVLYFALGSPAPLSITIDPTLSQQLMGIAPTPNKLSIYVVDQGNTTVNPIVTSDHSVPASSAIDMTPNGQLNQLLITTVTNPQSGVGTAVYGYVAGNSSSGISIFDTANGDVLDVGVTTTDDEPLPVSGVGPMVASTDGYIYITAASGNIGVVSDNPWVTENSVAYSGGASTSSSLGVGGTATVSFQADEVGTYTVRVGGSITTTSGTLITDAYGSTSGTVAAVDTAQSIYIPYDSNTAAFQEGENTTFIFVTDSASNVGRIAFDINVDTPPTAVTVLSSSFGNTRAYINFSRLTQNDINYYNVYVDTDPAAVTTKTAVGATVTQGSSSTLTGTVSGLTNGTLYYMAIEGVDNAGNVGPRTSTLADGSAISATPELTVGPAGYSGETGCSLVRHGDSNGTWGVIAGLLLLPLVGMMRWRRVVLSLMAVMMVLLSGTAHADFDNVTLSPSPIKKYGWFMDAKVSLWQPTSSNTKLFFPAFFNFQGSLEGGFLYNEQIGAELGVGLFYKTGQAIAAGSSATSQDSFNLLVVPMTLGGSYHFMYNRKQWVIPYARGGFEMDFFRENDSGTKIKGLKKGLYGGLGLKVPITQWMNELDVDHKAESQVYAIVEALYKWVNDFGGGGLNLSGAVYSLGFMVTF